MLVIDGIFHTFYGAGALDAKLVDRLKDIAGSAHSVPLHGRLFAQQLCSNYFLNY